MIERALSAAVETLKAAEKILVISHIGPDIDTVGSMLALKLALRKAGKWVTAYNADGLPPNMLFLPDAKTVETKLDSRRRFDATVCVDAGSADRFGPLFPGDRRRFGTIVKVDHHLTQEHFADQEVVDTQSASCAELVARLIRAWPLRFDRKLALCIYAAIVSDTGGFRYSNTNKAAFHWAAELLDYGVDPWQMTTMLYENRPRQEVRLLGDVLGTLDVSHDGRYASLTITEEMMARRHAEEYMTDGFINYARSINGVEVAILFLQRAPGDSFRVSFRSKGTVDVSLIAARLGGGGHHNAAGCRLRGALDDVKRKLYRMVEETLPKAAGRSKAKAAKLAAGM
ncbi:MAG: bifunctional oligoribonuclease/PAP phosphatase NrnA [Myxococcales bacterium]|nr:MAG: bifunctional oligoribonuclease/PAP phosphatase NrnA [Myxococcales bacterium]